MCCHRYGLVVVPTLLDRVPVLDLASTVLQQYWFVLLVYLNSKPRLLQRNLGQLLVEDLDERDIIGVGVETHGWKVTRSVYLAFARVQNQGWQYTAIKQSWLAHLGLSVPLISIVPIKPHFLLAIKMAFVLFLKHRVLEVVNSWLHSQRRSPQLYDVAGVLRGLLGYLRGFRLCGGHMLPNGWYFRSPVRFFDLDYRRLLVWLDKNFCT